MNGYNLPAGCDPAEVDAQCGPDEYEVTDTVINDAVEQASHEIFEEYLDGIHDIMKVAILPLCEIAIKDRTDDFLETFKQTGEFK